MCDPDALGSIRIPTKKREKDLPTKQGQACLKHAHPQVIQNLVSTGRHSAKRAKSNDVDRGSLSDPFRHHDSYHHRVCHREPLGLNQAGLGRHGELYFHAADPFGHHEHVEP